MPYDSSLDQCLFSKSWEGDNDRITVSVYSYNQGQKKLQITRENRNAQGEMRFTKLGRMTKDETIAVVPMIQEAIAKMD